jgi:hypothetical protein
MRVKWVIYDQRPTQPITVLIPEVTVIPERTLKQREIELADTYDKHKNGQYRLVRGVEGILEAFVRHNGALSDK